MLIVDGHNLTFADTEAKRLLQSGKPEASRQRVLALVAFYARSIRHQTTVVFDGTGGGQVVPEQTRIRCVFSGAGREADDEIVRLLEASTGRREAFLVTGDRWLAARAKRLRAQVISSSTFLKEVERLAKKASRTVREPAAKRTGAPRSDVEYWQKIFTDDDIREIEEKDGKRQ